MFLVLVFEVQVYNVADDEQDSLDQSASWP